MSIKLKKRTTINRNWILSFSFLICVLLNCVPYIRGKKWRNTVKVAIVCGVDYVKIKDNTFNNYNVSLSDTFPLYFGSQKGRVVVNGKQYRGAVEVRKVEGRIWVINVLPIEDYLKGVVPCEIGRVSRELIEAAKAQAVAARTYAYAHLNQYQDLGFDLYATVQDQVYKGMNAENEVTNLAIGHTTGQILVFKKRPIEAKYHSTCGGRTADFKDAWPGKPPPYLRSVSCRYCKTSPYYEWEKVHSLNIFFRNVRLRLKKIGIVIPHRELIKSFRIMRNKRSKRIIKLIIVTKKNEYVIPGYNIRMVFGDNNDPGGLLKSNFIKIRQKDDKVIIAGKGYGHGVGMCQFGAIEMARKGRNYKQILYHYYSGTRIKRTR